ncbi:MAG: DUF92 domain-containing protein [Candidatus Diapherotrites archaeon]|nr:DUF92 domain-containing protein [Candidatus Diapherotrites archaeon]
MTELLHAAIVLAVLCIFSIVSHKKKLLDFEGILVANIIGLFIFLLGDIVNFLFIVFFFIIAEASTVFARKNAKTKHEVRTTGNILGNSGAAVLCLVFNFPFGFFAALSAALADTLSSEIGLLSKRKPVLITTLEKVPHGTDGGVTPLGMYAALAGAISIASIHFYLFQSPLLFLVLIASGFIGSAVDSFFGAVFERKKMLNNAEVNFLGSCGGVAAGLLLIRLAAIL